MANLDFSSIPSREPLEEGIYLMTIEHIEEKTSSTGNPMLLVRFKEPETGTAVFENYVLLPQNMWKLGELVEACGIDPKELGSVDTEELIPMLTGIQVKAKITQDTYEGRITNRVKKTYGC